MAYVEYEPMVFSGKIKDLITFGCEYDEYKFKQIVEATGLSFDLRLMPHKENTEIGERGVNLSGG